MYLTINKRSSFFNFVVVINVASIVLISQEVVDHRLQNFFEQKFYSGIHGTTQHLTTWGAGLTSHLSNY